MSTPSDCRFSESHEWFRLEGDTVTLGITQFAANELTDITYVEMQPVGTSIQKDESAGEVEIIVGAVVSDRLMKFQVCSVDNPLFPKSLTEVVKVAV